MDNKNNRDNIYQGYIPPMINTEKVKSPSKMKIFVWIFAPIALIIVVFVALFTMFYRSVTGGFHAEYINTELSANPSQWSVYGREIHGTASKNFTGDTFRIEVDGDDEGSLEIKVTNTDTGELLLDKAFVEPDICFVYADGEDVEFEVTAYNFSGHFIIQEYE